jgi:hypothetical protein
MMAGSSNTRPLSYSHSQDTQPLSSDTSDSKNTNRHSPVAPLAPLEYLQNQRRGSITDPSLHATPNSHPHSSRSNQNSSPTQPLRHHISSALNSTSHDPNNKNPSSESRPASPYIFGDATAHSIHRQLTRTPSDERNGSCTPGEVVQRSHEQRRDISGSSHVGKYHGWDLCQSHGVERRCREHK